MTAKRQAREQEAGTVRVYEYKDTVQWQRRHGTWDDRVFFFASRDRLTSCERSTEYDGRLS